MNPTFELYKRKWREVRHLVFRNIFLFINVIIFSVAVLLISFGDIKEGIFIGIIMFINTTIAIIQDVHAWLTLEKLQVLMSIRVTKVGGDGIESLVLSEEIKKDDKIKLKFGDQIPCDGKLISAQGLEVNEGVITGESNSFPKSIGESVSAGSIVTSGVGLVQAETSFNESRIAKMTNDIKRYSENTSPIQDSINKLVKYFGYLLLLIIPFVIYRGVSSDATAINIVRNIGALSSMLVPQGLVIVTTLMFAYGAIYSFRRHVLLQDMNATEKLGRIKNLCMDKTGTLTENILTVLNINTPEKVSKDEALELAAAYVDKSGDASETIFAIKKFLNKKYDGEVLEAVPFSSSRRYGAVLLGSKYPETVILTGAPEAFMKYIADSGEVEWLENLLKTNATIGKRVLCLVRYKGGAVPHDLSDIKVSILAVFVLQNNLRDGISNAIKFFQDRGVRIRIISGDNPETVKAIALSAGINNAEAIVTGPEMEGWSQSDFQEKVTHHSIFARIKPEQKEKIIEALKKYGFTAMIGDGANDALAIKKADLGIAMFDGAGATRQLASVVLTNNSFSELPLGVKLADNVIENIEIFTSIFLNQTFLGFLLFILVSVLGYAYPFTPLNITFINYFTIGIPGCLIFYWAIHPREIVNVVSQDTFLKRVLPFPFFSSVPQFIAIVAVFIFIIDHFKNIELNTPIALTLMAIGMIFFFFVQSTHNNGPTTKTRKTQFILLALLEIIVLFFALRIPLITEFFNVALPSFMAISIIVFIAFIYAFVQYGFTDLFIKKLNT